MDIEESAAPYRGFLRSGSYPALTKRIVNSGGLLVRAAGWFALVVTAASAGYNMTQRLVSQSTALARPQVSAQSSAHVQPAPLRPELREDALTTEHTELHASAEPSRSASSAALAADKDKERSAAGAKRKQAESGAISHPQHTLTMAAPADVEASASRDSTARTAERVRALDPLDSAARAVAEASPKPALKEEPSMPAAVSGETPAASPFHTSLLAFASKPTPPSVRAPAAPPPPAASVKPAAQPQLPLAATARIESLAVSGSLTSANVRHGLQRVQPALAECYAQAARRAGENHFSALRVLVQFDEAGRVKTQPKVEGAQLPGLDTCVASAFSKLVCRAPDTGTARATLTLRFAPLELAATRQR